MTYCRIYFELRNTKSTNLSAAQETHVFVISRDDKTITNIYITNIGIAFPM